AEAIHTGNIANFIVPDADPLAVRTSETGSQAHAALYVHPPHHEALVACIATSTQRARHRNLRATAATQPTMGCKLPSVPAAQDPYPSRTITSNHEIARGSSSGVDSGGLTVGKNLSRRRYRRSAGTHTVRSRLPRPPCGPVATRYAGFGLGNGHSPGRPG